MEATLRVARCFVSWKLFTTIIVVCGKFYDNQPLFAVAVVSQGWVTPKSAAVILLNIVITTGFFFSGGRGSSSFLETCHLEKLVSRRNFACHKAWFCLGDINFVPCKVNLDLHGGNFARLWYRFFGCTSVLAWYGEQNNLGNGCCYPRSKYTLRLMWRHSWINHKKYGDFWRSFE